MRLRNVTGWRKGHRPQSPVPRSSDNAVGAKVVAREMKKGLTGKEYLALLAEELPQLLPRGFQRSESSPNLFTRRQPGRTERIGIMLNTKFWPYGRLNLSFGVEYDELQPLFDATVNQSGRGISHIYHETTNIHQMQGLPYLPRIAFMKIPFVWRFINLGDWPCYRDESPQRVIRRSKGAIKGVIEPFFRRFSDIREAWCSLRDGDGWNLQGSDERSVFAFGVFLEDWEGIDRARKRICRKYTEEPKEEMDEYLQRLRNFMNASRGKE